MYDLYNQESNLLIIYKDSEYICIPIYQKGYLIIFGHFRVMKI